MIAEASLALTAGVLLALSFPRFGHPAFAWIALVPLIIAISGWRGAPGRLPGQRTARAFTLGLIAGLVYFVGTVYWTSTVLREFGQVPAPVAIVGMLLLAAYLALYPAVAMAVTSRVIARAGWLGLFVIPAAWTGTEYLRGVLFSGFPWVPLGNSQITVIPVAQLASVFGVYGVTMLVALVNTAIAAALLTAGRQRTIAVATAAVAVAGVGAWGTFRVSDAALTRQGTPLRVGLIQANIAQEDKWDPRQARRIFTTYLAMTRHAVRNGAEFVLWPESSTPFAFEGDEEGQRQLRDLAREVRVPILFGSDQTVAGPPPRYYNAAFLLDPAGATGAVYRKVHLVPFGEYVPLASWLSFFPPLVQTLAGFEPFSAGEAVVLLPVGGRPVSTAICYEVVFPGLIRDAVLQGSELLTTITNDGWYGQSSAPFQHWDMAAMRAIEQGRYLARAANTGISGVVDPYGQVVRKSEIFKEVDLIEEVRLLQHRTIYSRVGDVVAYASLAVMVLALFASAKWEVRRAK
jgi:apolipoprotein N-acyltransferase